MRPPQVAPGASCDRFPTWAMGYAKGMAPTFAEMQCVGCNVTTVMPFDDMASPPDLECPMCGGHLRLKTLAQTSDKRPVPE